MKHAVQGEGAKSQGAITRDEDGVELWDRSWGTERIRLFPEVGESEPRSYWYLRAGSIFEENPERMAFEIVAAELGKVPTFNDFFTPGSKVLDLGCGGGSTVLGMSKDFNGIRFVGVDRALGNKLPFPKSAPENAKFYSMDWRALDFLDDSFDRVLSDQGVARYGNGDNVAVGELTRVAKVGALLRVTQDSGVVNLRNFSDRLCEYGWDVWIDMRGRGELVIARLVRKIEVAES